MSTPEQYDAIVIGSGEAGKFMSWHLGSQGQRVITIEKDAIGGACPNVACLPSKNVVHSAKVASYFQRGAEFGIVHGDWHVDMAAVRARKRKMVDGLHEVHLTNFKKSGAEIVMGFGRFIDAKTVQVDLNAGGTRTLRSDRIFIDTGSRATIDPIPGLAEAQPLTHIEALELDTLPEHLLILGGGYVGLELAQAMRRFGARVTVIERNPTPRPPRRPRRLRRPPPALPRRRHRDRHQRHASPASKAPPGNSSSCTSHQPTGDTILEGTHLLVATGRTPNTQNMGLELAGVKTTPSRPHPGQRPPRDHRPRHLGHGRLRRLPPLHPHLLRRLPHRPRQPGRSQPLHHRTAKSPPAPSPIPSSPTSASRETEAKQQGIAYRLAKIPMLAVLRTRTLSETRGFIKALIAADDRILGFTAFGTGAGELLPAVQLAMTDNLPYTALRDLIIAHPTLSEGLVVLFSAVPPP